MRRTASRSRPAISEHPAGRLCDGFAAGSDAELAQDRGDVMVDGLLGHDEAFSDFGVAEAIGEQCQDLEFAGC